MNRHRGFSIFGFLTLVALAAGLVWVLFQVLKLPLPETSSTRTYRTNTSSDGTITLTSEGALNLSTTTGTSTPLTAAATEALTSATTSSTGTSTKSTTPEKATTAPTKKP